MRETGKDEMELIKKKMINQTVHYIPTSLSTNKCKLNIVDFIFKNNIIYPTWLNKVNFIPLIWV